MSSSLRVNTIVPSTGTNVAIGTANGTVTFTDSVNFVLGTGSSIFSPASNTLTFGTNDAERLRITSDGKIGINQASPGAMLQVDYDEGSSEVGLRLRAYNASGSKTWQLSEINGNAGVFTIRNATNFQNILNIDGVNQRVGVNNTSPDHKVSVYDAGYCGLELKSNRSTSTDNIGGLHFKTQSTNVAYIQSLVDGTINFRNTSSLTERLRISSNGNIGIGENSPSAKLDVYLGDNVAGTIARFGGYNDGRSLVISNSGIGNLIDINHQGGSGEISVSTGGSERLRIGSGGNLALGGQNTSAYSGHTNLFLGGIANLYAETTAASTGSLSVSNNAYINSSGNWVYRVNGKASNVYQYDGGYGFRTAGTGSAGGTISWTERFSIDSSGRRTLQYQPGCKVSIDSNGTGGGNNTQTGNTVLPFNSTGYGYNIGNHFNTSNHTFTAPLAGRYLVLLSLNVIGDNIVYIYKNGSAHQGGEYRSNPVGSWEHCELSGIVECSANDTIKTHSYLLSSSGGRKFNGGTNPGSTWDTLSIYYLG